ncbi:MAG: MurR/RpiR family transcriptional regulator [Rhodospirillales bacterium]|nr:MurR/RpiR family transcriptional regulator [Rhodospirillales bacterium]
MKKTTTIRDTIEQFEGRLSRSDHKLIRALLATPGEGAFLTSIEVAQRAGVHPTTAVRLARKLGFSGYPELRIALREEFVVDSGADRVRKRLAKMADGSILQSLIDSEIGALQALPDYISQDQMIETAQTLIAADGIGVFGAGHASALADLVARRLNRSGYSASAFHHIGWETPEKIMGIGKNGVLVAFAFRVIPDSLPALLEFARANGARSIVVSDLIGPIIRPQPDILLAASRGREGESQSLTIPMAICNALILEMSKRDDGQSVASLDQLTEIRESLAQFSGRPMPEP